MLRAKMPRDAQGSNQADPRIGMVRPLIARAGFLRRSIRTKTPAFISEDLTRSMAEIAGRRRAARASRAAALRSIEGDRPFEQQQEFLAVAARTAREGRLSRFVYVA